MKRGLSGNLFTPKRVRRAAFVLLSLFSCVVAFHLGISLTSSLLFVSLVVLVLAVDLAVEALMKRM